MEVVIFIKSTVIDKSSICRVAKGFCESLVSQSEPFITFPFTAADKNNDELYHLEIDKKTFVDNMETNQANIL